ncbi:MAG: shikimate kinase [Hyphomicrobiales bacterium]|nr:shikimate kinase [Hyphomicrobiales bacterium]
MLKNCGLVKEVIEKLGNRSIVLVGMMGCGKTAIGRITANYLGLPFFDADEEIEKAAGMSVVDIFSSFGEKEFRLGESRVIARLLADNQSVLALGGGAFLTDDTRLSIVEKGISVWLRADLDILYSRVMRRPGKRPLLQNGDPKKTLIELMAKRKPYYAKADLVVDTSVSSKNVTRDRMVEALGKFMENETSDVK